MRSCVRSAITSTTVLWCLILTLLFAFAFPVIANEEGEEDEKAGWMIPAGTAFKNFYWGVGFGLVKNDTPDAWQDGSLTNIDDDKSDVSLSFFFGYQFNDYVGVQGAYRDLGESSLNATSSGGPSWSPGEVSGEQDADGYELAIVGRWPISERWYVLGLVGMYWWDSTERYWEEGFESSISESGNSVTYAVGFEFDHGLKDRIVYRFMGSHHEVGNDDYDVNGVSASVVYRFP